MRDESEIQRAHDILVAVVTGELGPVVALNPEAEAAFHGALDVLCWILRHDHNTAFTKNVARIEEWAKSQGYRLKKRVN